MTTRMKALAATLLAAALFGSPVRADTASGIADLMASIQSSRAMAGEIEALSNVTVLEVVDLDDVVAPAEAAALGATVNVDAPAVKDIHGAIEANQAVAARLVAEDVDLHSIVAANVHQSGKLRLYVR